MPSSVCLLLGVPAKVFPSGAVGVLELGCLLLEHPLLEFQTTPATGGDKCGAPHLELQERVETEIKQMNIYCATEKFGVRTFKRIRIGSFNSLKS